MQIWEIFFNSLTATLLHFSFVRKKIFYSENIQYVYNFYGTDLYLDVCRWVFKTQPNIYRGTSSRKSQQSFIIDVLLGSRYLSNKVKVNFKNLSLMFLLLELMKNVIRFQIFCCCCKYCCTVSFEKF